MQISHDGFVGVPNGEMNWIKVDEEIFGHVGKWSVHCPRWRGKYYNISVISILGVE
jgi:hypothetical protein